jgi:hypothetical protein
MMKTVFVLILAADTMTEVLGVYTTIILAKLARNKFFPNGTCGMEYYIVERPFDYDPAETSS